jgi:hypothetical protein
MLLNIKDMNIIYEKDQSLLRMALDEEGAGSSMIPYYFGAGYLALPVEVSELFCALLWESVCI